MAKAEVMGDKEFFQAALELPLDELERFFQDQFGKIMFHFRTALKADRVIFLRKHCATCPSAKVAGFEVQLEPCPKCGKDHVSLGKLDSCILTEVTAIILYKLLHQLEQMFQENWPMVYPAFIEELRAMRARLEYLREGDGADSEDDEDNKENEV